MPRNVNYQQDRSIHEAGLHGVCLDLEWQYFHNADKHLNSMADGAKQPRKRKGRSNYAICSKSYLEGKRSAKIKVLTSWLRKHESHTSECFSFSFFLQKLGSKTVRMCLLCADVVSNA